MEAWDYAGYHRSDNSVTADGRHSPRRSFLRVIARAVATITAGAATTLIVAGACAYFVRLPSTGRVVYTHRNYEFAADVMMWSVPGAKRMALVPIDPVLCAFDRDLIPSTFRESSTGCLRRFLRDTTWPAWGRVPDPSSFHTVVWAGVVQDARGWPFSALASEWVYDASRSSRLPRSPQLVSVAVGLDLSPTPPPRTVNAPGDLRAIPLRPIWSGLLANTAIYTALLGLVLVAVRQGRGVLRARRHRCPACAYSLTGQREPGCPECGWRRVAATA